jgi:hypothetical protein
MSGDDEDGRAAEVPVETYTVRPPREIGEIILVFRRDITALRDQIAGYPHLPTSDFAAVAYAAVGAAAAGLIALIGYYATVPSSAERKAGQVGPPNWEGTVLWCVLTASVGLAILAFVAAKKFKNQERNALGDILKSVDRLSYGRPAGIDPREAEKAVEAALEEHQELGTGELQEEDAG